MSRPFDGTHGWWRQELEQIAPIVHQAHPEGSSWRTCLMASCTRFRDVIAASQKAEEDEGLSDVRLAQLGLAAACEPEAEEMGVFPCELKPWEELDSESMASLTRFATAVREAIEKERGDRSKKRFYEAVERVFHKMTIASTADTAAWYILRDWLQEQKEWEDKT